MKKKFKMELLNSEESQRIRGGSGDGCTALDVQGCENVYFKERPKGCHTYQLNVIDCLNAEIKPCDADKTVLIACPYPNTK